MKEELKQEEILRDFPKNYKQYNTTGWKLSYNQELILDIITLPITLSILLLFHISLSLKWVLFWIWRENKYSYPRTILEGHYFLTTLVKDFKKR